MVVGRPPQGCGGEGRGEEWGVGWDRALCGRSAVAGLPGTKPKPQALSVQATLPVPAPGCVLNEC